MTEINPLAGAILASPQAQFQLAAEKSKQSRRNPTTPKDANGDSDPPDQEVERPDIVTLIGDDAQEHGDPERHLAHRQPDEGAEAAPEDDAPPHIDITG